MKNKLEELVKAPSSDLAEYTHPGVDLVAPQGSSIFPLADGVVVQTVTQRVDCTQERNKGNPFCYLGFMVRLKHGRMPGVPESLQNYNFTMYLHMDGPPTVQPGELVLSGTELGKVGNTGSAQGYHTHFELRHFPNQLLEEKNWNFPYNIYGAGDQRKSQLFQARWEDPQRFLSKLTRLSDSEYVSLEGFGRYGNLPVLPVPFYDPGVCPFEGCVYRDWQAKSNVPVYEDRRADSPVIYTVRKGEWVAAITGVVVVSKPGKIEFRKRVRLGETGLSADPGEVLSILRYEGEGIIKAWFKGVLLSYWGEWFGPGKEFCSSVKTDCSEALDNLHFNFLAGEVRQWPDTTWWVQVKDRSGRVGWTNQPDSFSNKDAFGSRDQKSLLPLPLPVIAPSSFTLSAVPAR